MFSPMILKRIAFLPSCLKCSAKVFSASKVCGSTRSGNGTFIHTLSSLQGKRGGFDSPRKLTNDESTSDDRPSIHGDGKYSIFKDSEADIILDVDEERTLIEQGFQLKQQIESRRDEFEGINLKRGVHGVYDLEDLIDVLRLNNAKSIFVASLPKEINYADFIVVASGQSKRHMKSLAEFIRKVFKKKCKSRGKIPHIEGANSDHWLALDLGNIVLHIMSNKAREQYDLESLWSVGYDYDSKVNDPDDPFIALLEEHTINLADFQPMDSEISSASIDKNQHPTS